MIFEGLREIEEEFSITIDGKSTVVKVRQSNRAKNIAIRVSAKGQPELVIPRGGDIGRAKSFLLQKLSWLRERLAEAQEHSYFDNSSIPIFGVNHSIRHTHSDNDVSIVKHENSIEIQSPLDCVEVVLIEYLKDVFLGEVKETVQSKADKHSLKYREVRLIAGTSRWGSCSSDGRLSFNWRLVFAPKNITKYLVAHELAHLKERNHSPMFWSLVDKIYSESREARLWLRKEGHKLQKILGNHK